jgi:hypothetical protein
MEIVEGNVVRLGPREHECGPRHVDLSFALVEGQLEWVGVAVRPLPGSDPSPLRAAELRDCLAVGDLITKAKAKLVRAGAIPGLEPTRRRRRSSAPSGRRRSPEHYAEVAEVYAEAVVQGQRNPTQIVAEHFPGTPHGTAAKWVRRARDLGYLRSTTQGRVSKPIVQDLEA